VSGNYTFTKSLITTWKKIFYLNENGTSQYDSTLQTRPLQDQADHIGNLSLLYKDTKHGIDAQLAFVYTGERITLVSQLKDLDLWKKPTLNLDFSVEKKFGQHFTLYLKAKNLLNEGYQLFIKQPNQAYSGDFKLRYQESPDYLTVEKDQYASSYLLGLRYKL
jgi:outer membrane receptor protein involved in Fe transport